MRLFFVTSVIVFVFSCAELEKAATDLIDQALTPEAQQTAVPGQGESARSGYADAAALNRAATEAAADVPAVAPESPAIRSIPAQQRDSHSAIRYSVLPPTTAALSMVG